MDIDVSLSFSSQFGLTLLEISMRVADAEGIIFLGVARLKTPLAKK